MIIYESTKKEFMYNVTRSTIVTIIREVMQAKHGKVGQSELNAWENSLKDMFIVLSSDEIDDDITVAIEYKIPATNRRIDFLITGLDQSDQLSVVIIELKQWSELELIADEDAMVLTKFNGKLSRTPHPSYQVLTYANLISQYNEEVEKENISLFPCAYLHNYVKQEDDPLTNFVYHRYTDEAPVFTKGDAVTLRNFISQYVKKSDNKKSLYLIDHGKLRPSKSLQDALLSMIKGNEEFYMIDEQKSVYEAALKMAKRACHYNEKQVLIVEGGPGTGKSVLSINLLVNLTAFGWMCQYVTKNSAPREVYASYLQKEHKQSFINNLFKGSGVYTESESNQFDCLIVDEAHRLNAKSGMFKNKGENQIMEIINASKFSVFFIDEYQKISTSDIGNKADIKKYAKSMGAKVVEMQLDSQFRCNGSDGYLAWIDDVLNIRSTANADSYDFEYDIRIFDDPNRMRDEIYQKNQVNNKARLVAGYCWNWISKGKDNKDVHDIVIPEHHFSMSWNLGNSSTWAIDTESVEQVGCIHTSQGLEFEYVGLIIGADLRYTEDGIVTDPFQRAQTDKSLSGFKKNYKVNPSEALEQADQIIKNTYRTLMSRGMKGCYIYCVDPALSTYLKKRLELKEVITYI